MAPNVGLMRILNYQTSSLQPKNCQVIYDHLLKIGSYIDQLEVHSFKPHKWFLIPFNLSYLKIGIETILGYRLRIPAQVTTSRSRYVNTCEEFSSTSRSNAVGYISWTSYLAGFYTEVAPLRYGYHSLPLTNSLWKILILPYEGQHRTSWAVR